MTRRDVAYGLLAALVLVLVSAAAYAIWWPKPITAADLRDARTVVDRYLDGYQRHDGRAICAELLPAHRAVIADSDDPAVCARRLGGLSRIPDLFPPGPVRVRLFDGGDGRVAGSLDHADGSNEGISLRRDGDRWRVDSDLNCVTPSCDP